MMKKIFFKIGYKLLTILANTLFLIPNIFIKIIEEYRVHYALHSNSIISNSALATIDMNSFNVSPKDKFFICASVIKSIFVKSIYTPIIEYIRGISIRDADNQISIKAIISLVPFTLVIIVFNLFKFIFEEIFLKPMTFLNKVNFLKKDTFILLADREHHKTFYIDQEQEIIFYLDNKTYLTDISSLQNGHYFTMIKDIHSLMSINTNYSSDQETLAIISKLLEKIVLHGYNEDERAFVCNAVTTEINRLHSSYNQTTDNGDNRVNIHLIGGTRNFSFHSDEEYENQPDSYEEYGDELLDVGAECEEQAMHPNKIFFAINALRSIRGVTAPDQTSIV